LTPALAAPSHSTAWAVDRPVRHTAVPQGSPYRSAASHADVPVRRREVGPTAAKDPRSMAGNLVPWGRDTGRHDRVAGTDPQPAAGDPAAGRRRPRILDPPDDRPGHP